MYSAVYMRARWVCRPGSMIARRGRHSSSLAVSVSCVFEDADARYDQSSSDWIPEYLQSATQIALRAEMQKARAESDVEGYIYAFEILGSFSSHVCANSFNGIRDYRSR